VTTNGSSNIASTQVMTSTDPAGGRTAWIVRTVKKFSGIVDISCPSVSLCVGAGAGLFNVANVSRVVTSTDPIGGAGAWKLTRIKNPNASDNLTGISCPSVLFCLGADADGGVLTSTHPAGGSGDWVVSGVDGTNSLTGISCPSVSFCLAVDLSGQVVASTDPTGNARAWRVNDLDPYVPPYAYTGPTQGWLKLSTSSVACPTASSCVAIDSYLIGSYLDDSQFNGMISTKPTGKQNAWHLVDITNMDTYSGPGSLLTGLSCPSVSLCVATTNLERVLTSTDPTRGGKAWTTTVFSGLNYSSYLSGVSCPSASLCVIVDQNGDVLTSTDPTGGSDAWTVTSLDGVSGLDDISCPTISFCVASDVNGVVATSTDPTGGPDAWSVTSVYDTNSLNAVTCPSVSLCAAVDDRGDVLVSSDPASSGSWVRVNIDGMNALNAISCPSVSLCIAVDDLGNVIVGSSPQ
jgi:hypothetical protein